MPVDDSAEHVGRRHAGGEVRHKVANDAAEQLVLVLRGELAEVLGGDADTDDPVDKVGEAERGEAGRPREVRMNALNHFAVAAGVRLRASNERLDPAHILVGERGPADNVGARAVPNVIEEAVNKVT